MAWMDVSSQWGQDLIAMEMDDNYLDRGYYHGEEGESSFVDYPEDYPLDDDYGSYDPYDGYYDDDMYYSKITASELFDQCIVPTMSQACQTVVPLLGMCFVSRVTSYFVAEGKFHNSFHCCGFVIILFYCTCYLLLTATHNQHPCIIRIPILA